MSDIAVADTQAAQARPGTIRLRKASRATATTLFSALLLLACWQAVVTVLVIPSYVLPKPIDVWIALVDGLTTDPTSRASFWYHLVDTLHATVLGFAIGSFIGVVLAAMMSEFRIVQRIVFPYIVGFQCLPKVAIAPLYIIWFGYQIQSKVAMSATLVIFPVVLNSMEGFLTVERERLELMASLDAGRWQTFWTIKFPGALAFIFTGLSLGIVHAFLGTIVAEFIGAQRGMGVLITQLQSVSDTAGVFAILVVLAIAGFILINIVRALQRRFVFWSGSGKVVEAV